MSRDRLRRPARRHPTSLVDIRILLQLNCGTQPKLMCPRLEYPVLTSTCSGGTDPVNVFGPTRFDGHQASPDYEPPRDVPIESSGRSLAVGKGAEVLTERAVHLPRKIALQAADGLAFRPTLLHASLEVRTRTGAVA